MKNVLISFLLLSISFSCGKEIIERVPFKRIPNDLKAYWNFKPGTYWIYKDSISGYIDSVYVTDLKMDSGYGFQGKEKIVYQLLQLSTVNLNGDEYKYWVNSTYTQDKAENFNIVNATKTIHNPYYDFVDENTSFVYPYIIGLSDDIDYNMYIFKDTVIVRNFYSSYFGFNDVVEIENKYNALEGITPTYSFYAKNIGLIKLEVPDSNKFRRLISYHIVQ